MSVSRPIQLILEKLFNANDIYISQRTDTSFLIDKLSFKGNATKKVRYIVNPIDSTCTCKGYQHRGRCKHIEMCLGEWDVNGAPRHHVAELVKDILHELGDSAVPMEIELETLPKMIKNLTIPLTDLNKDATILINRDFGDKESCVFIFKSKS